MLLVSIVGGMFLSRYARRQPIIDRLTWASRYVFLGLHWVMRFAPIGAFGGMAFTIGKYGVGTLHSAG